jgi:uncharacterized repeat protein (TIGR01451 family)
MPLSDINKQLYKKEGEEDSKKKAEEFLKSDYDPMHASTDGVTPPPDDSREIWIQQQKGLNERQRKFLKIGLISFGSILLLALLVMGYRAFNSAAYDESKVNISINGPVEIGSGKMATYEIAIKNDNRASLKNAILRVNYPESFKPENNENYKQESPVSGIFNVKEIPGHSEMKIVFNGRAYNPKGALMYLKTDLQYEPSNIKTQFITKQQLGISVISSPVFLEVSGPQNISSGDAVEYVINYRNDGDKALTGIKIKAEYPAGFKYTRSDPESTENQNGWYIGTLEPGQSGRVSIKGRLDGNRDEVKKFTASIGSVDEGGFGTYNEESFDTKISGSPLSISQTVNKKTDVTVSAGETLYFEINFRNDGPVGLKNTIVTQKLDSSILDYGSLKLENGGFDNETKLITWKFPDIPQLKNFEPGSSGTIKYSINVKKDIPVKNENDKNFIISSIVKIDSPDIQTPIELNKTIAGNTLDIKLISPAVLNVGGFYRDKIIANTGPIPPVVDQETTYTLHWRLANYTNDLEDVKIVGILPTQVKFTGQTAPSNESIEFNERTNEITWNIGKLKAGTGATSDAKEVMFQVKVKPSPDQVGQSVNLLEDTKFSARDTFTGDLIRYSLGKKDNILIEEGRDFPYRVQAN